MGMIVALAVALGVSAATLAPVGPPPPGEIVLPVATLDDTLDVVGSELAAKQIRTRMFVPVEIDGRGPYRFLVDSGADRSVIGSALAQELQLAPGPPVTLRGMAGSSQVGTALLRNLKLGESRTPEIVAPILLEQDLGAQGLIGIDALAEQRLMFDFDTKTITVQDSRRPAAADPDEIVVTAFRRNGQLILTEARVAGTPLFAVIDTGSEITVGNSVLRERIMRRRKPMAVQQIELISVTGHTILADLIVVPEVRIGKLVLASVPIAFVDAPPFALFGLSKSPALLVGTDILKSFRKVSLDFRRRKVRFVLRR